MNKKRAVTILLFIAIIVILTVIVILSGFRKNRDDKYVKFVNEGDVTRYEWIKMLCEQEGVTEYENEIPYFSDVNMNSVYFPYLQSAVEWEVIDIAADFDGESYASGYFIALTAMKIIGESKLQSYLDIANVITDDKYIELAIEHGLIKKEQLIEGFSIEECEQVLERLKNLYFDEFWKDDHSHVTYKKGVIELSSDDVLQSDINGSEIVIADNMDNALGIGTIIIFEQENTKLKFARKITEIDSDGTLSLSPVELDDVVESLIVSDITELTFSDIINYYGLEERFDALSDLRNKEKYGNLINTLTVPIDLDDKGFKLSVYTEADNTNENIGKGKDERKQLKVKVTDNNTGISYDLPITEEVEADCEYSVEIDIDKILIGGQVEWSRLTNLNADIALDVHSTFKGELKGETEKKIPLFKTPVPLGGGVVGVDIQIFLVLSLDGSISFEVGLPVNASVNYENGKGLRHSQSISAEISKVEANCEIASMLRIEPTLLLLGSEIVDVELDIGVAADANITTQPNSQVCADISVSLPVFTISVCGDDAADTIIGNLGVSAEWEIVSSEDAPIKFGLHYEILTNNTVQFVEKCTYKEGDEDKPDIEKAIQLNNTYYTRYKEITGINEPVFAFDYPDNWSISKEEVNGNSTPLGEYAEEIVELSNESGIKITFIKLNSFLFEAGGRGRFYEEYKAIKMADAVLKLTGENVADSSGFVVVKLGEIGSMVTDTDSDIQSVDGEHVSYAVMQENVIDRYEGKLSAVGSVVGYYDMISFNYSTPYVFYAESPDGQFTEEEEKEVMAILSSFRNI